MRGGDASALTPSAVPGALNQGTESVRALRAGTKLSRNKPRCTEMWQERRGLDAQNPTE